MAAAPTAAHAIPVSAVPLLQRLFAARWRDASVRAVTGTANQVFRLDLDGESFALRVPRVADAVTGVDRRAELAAQRAAASAGLAAQIVACDSGAGILVTRWLAGEAWTSERARGPAAIARIAGVFRRLHALPPPPEVRHVRVDALVDHYIAVLQPVSTEAADLCRAVYDVARERMTRLGNGTNVLCHNDVHHGNVVDTPTGICLLDWEYAGLGPASFDLAGYASYQDLDGARTAALLRAYGADAAAVRNFADWRWLFEYVWVLWLVATAGDAAAIGSLTARLRSGR